MAEKESGGVKSDDLMNEVRLLEINLERSNMEKASAAEYGLAILEEKNALKSCLEQKEGTIENLKIQLACAQEALVTMQQHNKALEEAEIAEEERRMIHEELVKREKDDLENELRSCRKHLCRTVEEKERVEDVLKQSYALNEVTKAQLKKTREDLKECESKETFALKNCDVLESDNLELQLQVSQLLKSVQDFDAVRSENRRLLERLEELAREAGRANSATTEMERSLRETNDMLKDEREMKMRYKRELDSRILSDEGTFLNASAVASLHGLFGGGGPSTSLIGDVSVDNISALLDGFMVFEDDDNEEEEEEEEERQGSAVMNDSLEDLAADSGRKERGGGSRRRNRKSLMSELMMSRDEYVANVEQLELENLRLNKNVEDLTRTIQEMDKEIKIEGQPGDEISKESKTSPISTSNIETQTEASPVKEEEKEDREEESLEDAVMCLQNLRMVLLDMVTEAQTTYSTLCDAGDESLNSKAVTHVEARKASVAAKVGRSEGRDAVAGSGGNNNIGSSNSNKCRIPSFVLSKSLPKSPNFTHESVWSLEVDCTKLLASSIDLMRYSRRVAHRMLDTKMAVRARESSSSSLLSSSLATSSSSSFSNGHFLPAHHHHHSASTTNLETQEQIVQLQSLLAAKTEQMMSLRQMLTANKAVYESSVERLKQQHDDEMAANARLVEELRGRLDELRGREGTKLASEQTLIKQRDQYSSQMNDLQERLSSSELERRTLNSLLRIAIQHKLLLVKKLQNHGISVDLFSDRGTEDPIVRPEPEKKRGCPPSPRPPLRSRLERSPPPAHLHPHHGGSSGQKQSSFVPLLYTSTRNK